MLDNLKSGQLLSRDGVREVVVLFQVGSGIFKEADGSLDFEGWGRWGLQTRGQSHKSWRTKKQRKVGYVFWYDIDAGRGWGVLVGGFLGLRLYVWDTMVAHRLLLLRSFRLSRQANWALLIQLGSTMSS